LTRDPKSGTALTSPLLVGKYIASTIKEGIEIPTDIVHCNAYYPILAGRILSLLKSIPMVSTIHDLPEASVWKEYAHSNLWGLLGYSATLISAHMARGRVLTVSQRVKEKLVGYGIRNLEVIPNGVDLGLFDSARRVVKEQYQVLYVGRLVSYKRVDVLIGAVKKVLEKEPRAKLVVVGEGPERSKLERLASEMGISDRTIFTGTLKDESAVAVFFNSSSIFVLPSPVEGEGIVLKEAMAARLPVVVAGSSASGASGLVKHGWNGILVKPGDPDQISQGILTLLTDPALREKMGKNGRSSVESNTWDVVTEKTLRAYSGAIEN
jgi:glycosyltransferase involved in cell wall biosynthesis